MTASKSKYLADFEEEMRDGDILVPEHRPCYSFHATGVCKFRARNLPCDFVHNHIDYKNSRQILDMQQILCADYINGHCKMGARCFNIHNEDFRRMKAQNRRARAAAKVETQKENKRAIKDIEANFSQMQAQAIVPYDVQFEEMRMIREKEFELMQEEQQQALIAWNASLEDSTYGSMSSPNPPAPVNSTEPLPQTVSVINAKPVTAAKPVTQTAQATQVAPVTCAAPVNQTKSKVQQPKKKGRKNQKKKKTKVTAQANAEANATISVKDAEKIEPTPAKIDGDEHACMESDGWAVTKRVNSAWSKSAKNLPALPSPSEKTQMKFPSDVTITTGKSSGKTPSKPKSKPATWSRKVLAPTGRQNDLVSSGFPPLAGGKPLKKSQLSSTGSRWSKPLITIPEHPVKGKEADMPTTPIPYGCRWDPRDEIFIWATQNLAPEKQLAYLKNYFAPKKEQQVVKYDSAAHELNWKGRTQFSDLPYEIRHMIWELILKDRVGTCARLKLVYEYVEKDGVKSEQSFLRRYNSQPLLLRLNHESRVFALKHYELAFGTAYTPGMTYFNFDRDRLHLDTHGFNVQGLVDAIRPEDRNRVKVVAISIKDWLRCDSERELCHQIARFRNLKRWFLIAGDGRHEQKYLKDKTFMRYAMSILKRECHKLYGPRNDWGNWNGVHTIPDSAIPRFGWKVVDVDTARHLKIDDIRW